LSEPADVCSGAEIEVIIGEDGDEVAGDRSEPNEEAIGCLFVFDMSELNENDDDEVDEIDE
jgi:hypothetical protein